MKCLNYLVLLSLYQFVFLSSAAQDIKDSVRLSSYKDKPPYSLDSSEWKIIRKIWKHKSDPVSITLNNGKCVTGQVISLDEKNLFLWMDKKSFPDPGKPDLLGKICFDSVIKAKPLHYPFYKRGLFWGSVIAGIAGTVFVGVAGEGWIPPAYGLIAAPAGLFIGYLIDGPKIKEKNSLVIDHKINPLLPLNQKNRTVIYPYGSPDYIKNRSYDNKGINQQPWEISFDSLLKGAVRLNRILREPKLYLAAGVGYASTRFYENRTNADIYSFLMRYNISKNYYTGFVFKYYKGNNIVTDHSSEFPELKTYKEYEGIYTKRYSINFNYRLATNGRFVKNRLEGLFGVAVSLNDIKYSHDRFYETDEGIYLNYYKDVSHMRGGIGLEAEGSWFFSNKMSFFLNTEKNFVLPLWITPEILVNPANGAELASFSQRKFDQSSFDLVFGLALHF